MAGAIIPARIIRWLPVPAAVAILAVAVAAALRTPHIVATAPPLPRAVHVASRDVGDIRAEIAAPLLSPTRSNGPKPAVTDTPPPTVTGIVGNGGRRAALLKPASGETVIGHVGDVVDGWTVVAIAAKTVTIDNGKGQRTIELGFGGDASASAAPAASPISPLPRNP